MLSTKIVAKINMFKKKGKKIRLDYIGLLKGFSVPQAL